MAKDYKTYLEPFILVLGVMLGIALAGSFVESMWGAVLGFQIPIVQATLGAVIVGALSLLGTKLLVDKWM